MQEGPLCVLVSIVSGMTTCTVMEVEASSGSQTLPRLLGSRDPSEIVRAPTMKQLQDEEENLQPPLMFKIFVLALPTIYSMNYTVTLPTAHDYVASLGGGGWFAGMVVAASLACGVMTVPLSKCFFSSSYKPVLFLLITFCAVGNALYGLGQVAQNLWVLLLGRAVQGLWWGGCGATLCQHVSHSCIEKKQRSAWTATTGNVAFLGMGMGPIFAAALSKVNFSVGLLEVDELTSPGWFFCVLWLLLLVTLVFIPEPARPFATNRQSDGSTGSTYPNAKIIWSLSTTLVTSAVVAGWETSAAVVTQKYFAWSISASSLFIGAIFLSSSLGGEAVKLFMSKREVPEADVTTVSLGTLVVSSALLYWYLPISRTPDCIGNELAYVIGSILVLNAANVARNYSLAIAMRESASVSVRMKDMAVGAQALFMMCGRSLGALCGMGIAALPGGANGSAALMTSISALMLSTLLIPELFASLRRM
mmetsp:Transcript_36117/g.65486  ORF Transcript_36117/g.65486 Transcript_36117/m.65486 type:complete len:477 (+) Transcript_36117:27-1457(+)